MTAVLPGECDVLVIGAGPAGAVSALLLARQGWHVVLVERCAWPRAKVCGGCVNAQALSLLRSIGVDLCSDECGDGCRIDQCIIRHDGRSVTLPLAPGIAIERDVLDATLVNEAVRHGADFIHHCSARVHSSGGHCQSATLSHDGRERTIHAKWILACDGIGGSSLYELPWAKTTIRADSYIGVSTTIAADESDVPERAIVMTVGEQGYVGQVRCNPAQPDRRHLACIREDFVQAGCLRSGRERIHVAAALDPRACQSAGSPGEVAARIVNNSALRTAKWTGVGRLTRHRSRCGGEFVLVVGDASGYVEPFTGEGIAWAIASAIDAAEVIRDTRSTPDRTAARWQAIHDTRAPARQRMCHVVRYGLRRPTFLNGSLAALEAWPAIGRWITRPTGASPLWHGRLAQDSAQRVKITGEPPVPHAVNSLPLAANL